MPVKTSTREDFLRMRTLTRQILDENRPRRRRRSNPKPIEHGTRTAYNRHRCRCEDCSRANREYLRQRSANPKPFPVHLHGTLNAYDHLGCRCDKCRDVASAARVARQRKTKKCERPNCRERIERDGRKKYCSDKCQMAANQQIRRKSWRESKQRKKASEAATPAAGRSQLKE